MDQRPPPCAHRAPRMPVPSTSTPHGSLYTQPHHTNGAYRPLLSSKVGYQPEHRYTGFAGYSSLPSIMSPMLPQPYSMPETMSPFGITYSPLPYEPYPWLGGIPYGTNSETQDIYGIQQVQSQRLSLRES
jgi:hypothetical protein